ncbi:MAG: hypothetical protein KY464_09985 [Gemmatimonadetes bacterium]|nr:hypothetical protein [Gemmatimonadota bacterium]
MSIADVSPSRFRLALAAAIGLGVLIRTLHVLPTDFPLNDGGMFYAMVRDIQNAGYRLPDFTSYNGLKIPFAYPPLAFYAAAALDAVTPLSLFDVFRFLPLAATCLTVYAFSLLARAILSSRSVVVAAVFAFSLLPTTFTWPIMGGGLTRSVGFLFAILALQQSYLLYTRRSWRYVPLATLFCGLTVLSHLGTVPFLAFSIAFFFVARGRHWHGLVSSIVVALGTLAVSAPWWATILGRHGVDPFLAAKASGGSAFSTYASIRSFVVGLLNLMMGSTYEPMFPVLLTLTLVGVFIALAGGRYLLPAWWAVIVLTEHRAGAQLSSLPIAMLAGIGAVEALIPAVARARTNRGDMKAGATLQGGRKWWLLPSYRVPGGLPVLVLAFLVAYASLAALAPLKKGPSALVGAGRALESLAPEDRAAMRWVARKTSPASRFLVITGSGWEPKIVWAWGARSGWADDRVSEWFPVLAERTSVATVQGSEWFPGDAFAKSIHSYEAVQRCANWTSECLDEWSAEAGRTFTHVYVPKSLVAHKDPDFQCCQTLWASLEEDPRYQRVYDGPAAAIYARVS